MADIPPATPQGVASPLYAAIKQSNGVATCSTAALNPLSVNATSYADARAKGLEVPTTGLLTQWTLINVPRALSFTGRATAIEARVGVGGAAGYGNVVLAPQTRSPVLDLVLVRSLTADAALRGGVGNNGTTSNQIPSNVASLPAFECDFPDLSTPYLPAALVGGQAPGAAPKIHAFLVGQALSSTSLSNEFVQEPLIAAHTDWVITMPTRRFNITPVYPGGSMPMAGSAEFTNLTFDDSGNPLNAGTKNYFVAGVNILDFEFDPICVRAGDAYSASDPTAADYRTASTFRDQESADASLQREGDPATRPPFRLCGQTMVLRFSKPLTDASLGVLGSVRNRWDLRAPPNGGWGRVSTAGIGGLGLPIIGFAAMELFNGAVMPGFAGSFGQTYPHSTTAP